MSQTQLRLCDGKSSDCPFRGYIEEDDNHCNSWGMSPSGYETIAEDSQSFGDWLAEVRWVDINDVHAKNIPIPKLSSYIPTVTCSSAKLFTNYQPRIVSVKLGDVVSPEKLIVADSLEKHFGIPPDTQVILQCYGKDRLLENLWPHRYEVFAKLAKLNFAAVTGVNYSVWRSQPHAERLINIKRAHLTYEDWQNFNMPAIPHIYWCGHIGIDSWLQWLEDNPCVQVVAIDMQTMRRADDWAFALADLKYFISMLKRPIHFLITGLQSYTRIAQIKQAVPYLTITNGYPALKAFASQQVEINGLKIIPRYSDMNKSLIFKHNVEIYQSIITPNNFSEALYNRYLKPIIRHKPVGITDNV